MHSLSSEQRFVLQSDLVYDGAAGAAGRVVPAPVHTLNANTDKMRAFRVWSATA